MTTWDTDAMDAGLDLIGRTGAKSLEIGYLHEDVPAEQAAWYATVLYQGAKIIEEDHRGPVKAVEALARRLLTGGMCTHCGGLIALSDGGALAHIGSVMADGSVMTEARARAMGQCRWRRHGPKWVRGCEDTARPGPPRRERRAHRARR